MDGRSISMILFALPFLYYQYRVTDFAYDTWSIAYVWHWSSPARLTVPFYAGLFLFIYATAYGLYALAFPGTDPHITTAADLGQLSLRCFALIGLMVAKGYFGPAVSGYVVASVATSWLTTGDPHIPALFDLLLGAVFGAGWDPLHVAYTLFIAGNGVVSPLISFKNAVEVVSQ